MSYKGKYRPTNKRKYKGDVNSIVYRSLWERKFMVYLDTNPDITEWGSEEIVIPYVSPLDGKRHRYFPDFYVRPTMVTSFWLRSNRSTKPDLPRNPNQKDVTYEK